MSQTCPKCHHVRQPGETTPSWQCPACGVAYAKVAPAPAPAADNAPYDARSQARRNAFATPARSTAPRPTKPLWLAALAIAFTVYALWSGAQAALSQRGGASRQELRALAATVRPGEVVMYSTQDCGYCVQAKSWLTRHGFAFTECDIERVARCEREFTDHGADGTPYLLVRGQPMQNGFDADEFVALLRH
jgi:glutaredoxin